VTRAAVLVCIALLAAVAAGCGGDDEASAESTAAWADGFCTAVQSWTDELERIGEDLGDVSSLSGDAIRDAAEQADSATDEFIQELRDLGAPDTESGDVIESEIDELSDAVEDEREKLREAAEDAESGLTETAAAIATLGSSITVLGTALQETLQAIEDADAGGELETAFEESEACDSLES
jgi:hypothetical protein